MELRKEGQRPAIFAYLRNLVPSAIMSYQGGLHQDLSVALTVLSRSSVIR